MKQQPKVQAVRCPHCGTKRGVPSPDGDEELEVRPYVAAFGEHRKVECRDGHVFWVYYC